MDTMGQRLLISLPILIILIFRYFKHDKIIMFKFYYEHVIDLEDFSYG
jgi:hypothetical protein